MNDIRALLSDADPLRSEPVLSSDDVRAMRKRVMDAAAARPARPRPWRRAMAAAALLTIITGAGMVASRRFVTNPNAVGPSPPPGSVDVGERLQVQFATPGGTRIIWTINPDFRLDEVIK